MNETVLEEPRYFFWLCNGQEIRSINQLIEMVPTLTDEQFRHHVNESKNDFYNWIMGVFADKEVADVINSCRTRDEFQEKLWNFLLEEKKKKEEGRRAAFEQAQRKAFVEHADRFSKFHETEARREEKVADTFDAAARRFQEKKQRSILPETITRTDAMLERLRELRDYITETRKGGRDPVLADLVLKRFSPKMEYAKITQDEKDFDLVEAVLKQAERELEAAVMAPLVDARKELELLLSLTKDKPAKAARESAAKVDGAAKTGVSA